MRSTNIELGATGITHRSHITTLVGPRYFTFVSPFLYERMWKVIFYHCPGIKINVIQAGCIFFSLLDALFLFTHFLFCLASFLGPHQWHMEVLGLGVESELQLLAYTTATATLDPSLTCDLHHSEWQCRILNPLSKVRVGTCVLMDASQIR